MRRRLTLSAPLIALALATPASAEVAHTVAPGETLWSIAAANNLTTRTVATYNGLPEEGHVVLGSTVRVPTVAEGAAALQAAGHTPGAASGSADASSAGQPAAGAGGGHTTTGAGSAQTTGAGSGHTSAGAGSAQTTTGAGSGHTSAGAGSGQTTPGAGGAGGGQSSGAGAPTVQGAYSVRAGDTLSALAANAGVSVGAMAAMNGLDPSGPLIAGTPIKLPGGAPTPARAHEPASAPVVAQAAPAATNTHVTAGDIQTVASEHGVSPSLAAAIAWQESGFNNAAVSSANARGVMQVMPGTWDYVQQNLATRRLDPNSADDNVHAGVLYLKRLLNDTGGDENSAIAGYYQGLASVRERGLYDDTTRYVNNVQALRGRFGG